MLVVTAETGGIPTAIKIGKLKSVPPPTNAFDVPARQALVYEMVDDKKDLPNALALNSIMVNIARLVGPAISGIVLQKLGAGAEVTRIGTVEDTSSAHREALIRALEHDVVITTGGVSVGPHDLVRGIGAELGVEEVFWRVALRPGKPIWFGVHERTLVFGLPGNPVSSLVCFELFVRPALLALQGAPFRPGNVGTSLQQLRRHADRHLGQRQI